LKACGVIWREGDYLINVYRLQGSDKVFIKIKKVKAVEGDVLPPQT